MSLRRNSRHLLRGVGSGSRVEALEDRIVLAAAALTPGVTFEGTTLKIVTGEGADTVTVTDDGAGNISAEILTAGGETLSGSGTGVTRVVFTGRGDDVVNYAATAAITVKQSLFFALGRDGATANFDFSSGVDGELNAIVFGGKGDDAVTASFGDISGKVRFGSELAAGTDSFNLSLLGDILAGATAVFGAGTFGTGNFSVAASEVDIAADALLGIALVGGRGADTMGVTYSGLIDGTLQVLEDGGWGNDILSAEITVNEGSVGKLNAAVLGSFGDDTQTLNVIDNTVPAVTPTIASAKSVRGLLPNTSTDTGLSSLRAVVGDVFGTNTLTHTDNVYVIEPPVRPVFGKPRRK